MFRRHLGHWAALVLLPLLLVLALLRHATADAPSAPSLDLTPSDLTADAVSPDRPVFLEVRLKAGSRALGNIAISTFSNDAIDVRPSGGGMVLPVLPGGAEQTWRLQLTHAGGIVAAAKLYVRAAFDAQPGDGAPVRQFLYATANIAPVAAVTSSALAKAEILGDAIAVSHERPGQLLLQITNQYSRNLTIGPVVFLKPEFVAAGYCPPDATDPSACLPSVGARDPPSAPVPGVPTVGTPTPPASTDRRYSIDLAAAHLAALPPGQATIVPFAIGAAASVVPGKYTIAAEVTVASDDTLRQTVLSSHEVDVEVLGESELIKLVGIPSLLFLPGVLAIVTWQLLWSWGKTSDERGKFLLQPTSSPFWVSAIALSLLGAWLYPWTSGWALGERRDYLVSYGVKDFAFVFALSIGATSAAYIAVLIVTCLWRKWQAHRLAQSVPKTGDLPQQILEKLATIGHEASGRAVYPVGGNQAAAVLVLEPWSDDAKLWLAPPARLTLVIARDHPDYYQALDEQDQLVTGQVTEPDTLATQVRLGVENGWWTIAWETVGTIGRPASAKPAAWADLPRRMRLIR